MSLTKSLVFLAFTLGVFLCGVFSGYSFRKPPIKNETYEVVYERDCYPEFDEQEVRVKPLTVQDLEDLE